MAAAGGAPTRLTDDAGIDVEPAWSPDGRTLAFASTRTGTGLDLLVVDLRLDGASPVVGPPRVLAGGPGDQHAPAWSHHGDRVAYVEVNQGQARILSVTGGGEPVPLTDGPEDGGPCFSPDDSRLAYSAPLPGQHGSGLWLIELASGERRSVGAEPFVDLHAPRFSADGRYLVATAVARTPAGAPLFAAVAFVDLERPGDRVRALLPPLAPPRLGVDVRPAPLDGRALAEAPRLIDAMADVVAPP